MGSFDGLRLGFDVAFTVQNLVAAFAGSFAGTAVGVLPGIGPVAGAALILPLTLGLDPVTGIIALCGVYAGSMYGGSTTSVLLNMPGEAASVVTALDGYKLTQRGRAGAVLAVMAVGSFVAGSISIVLVTMFAPIVGNSALLFGPVEFFALTAGGLLLLARISGGSLGRSLLPMMLGIALGTIGLEGATGVSRFTLGIYTLTLGVSIVPVAVGLYGVAELMRLAETPTSAGDLYRVKLRELLPTRAEIRRSWPPWFRGTGIGFAMGLLPGPSATMSSFLSYRAEQRFSRYRHELGHGAIEGAAGPEAANNAAAISSMIPILALGIPFSATLALVLAALQSQGVTPGPLLIVQHPDIYWGVIAAMYIGNVMLLVLNLPLVSVWVAVLRLPMWILVPTICVTAVIGTYSVRASMVDVRVLVALGIIGYVSTKLDLRLAPLIIGLILGPLVEKHFREAMALGRGDLSFLLSTPIAVGIWAVVALAFIYAMFTRASSTKRERADVQQ